MSSPVIVDIHEPERIIEELRKGGLEVIVEKGATDYQVGYFLIERKSIGDLLNSAYSARIFKQLGDLMRLRSSGEYKAILAVMGEFPPKSTWTRIRGRSVEVLLSQEEREKREKSIISTMNSALISFGVNVFFFPLERHFVKFIIDLHYRLTEHIPKRPVLEKKGDSVEDNVFSMLTSIKGIGAKRAQGIIESGLSLLDIYKIASEKPEELKSLIQAPSVQRLKEAFIFKKEKKEV